MPTAPKIGWAWVEIELMVVAVVASLVMVPPSSRKEPFRLYSELSSVIVMLLLMIEVVLSV